MTLTHVVEAPNIVLAERALVNAVASARNNVKRRAKRARANAPGQAAAIKPLSACGGLGVHVHGDRAPRDRDFQGCVPGEDPSENSRCMSSPSALSSTTSTTATVEPSLSSGRQRELAALVDPIDALMAMKYGAAHAPSEDIGRMLQELDESEHRG